ELIESGYLTEVHKFSKFIHGTATLFPDMVRAVPYWVDDESVRSSMLASAPPPAPVLAASASMPRVNKPRKTAKPSNGSHLDELSHPLLGEQPTLKLMKDRDEVSGLGTTVSAARQSRGPSKPSWIMQALGLAPTAKALERGLPMKIEPKTFFANERTFLAWLHMAVTLGSIAAALLGFSSGGSSDPGMETHALSRNLVEIIALILLPLAMAMCAYALYTFSWRASNIAKKKTTHFDDRYGPLVLCSAVVVALCAIFLISCIDFYLMVQDAGQAPVPEPSPENSIPLAML
ncbi:vacuolar transporter chaperone 4, partial [Haematococcus lacustris]